MKLFIELTKMRYLNTLKHRIIEVIYAVRPYLHLAYTLTGVKLNNN